MLWHDTCEEAEVHYSRVGEGCKYEPAPSAVKHVCINKIPGSNPSTGRCAKYSHGFPCLRRRILGQNSTYPGRIPLESAYTPFVMTTQCHDIVYNCS
jgi:hypothetical protein